MTEDLGRILASVSGGDIEPLKQLVENQLANEYVRSAALQAFLVLVAQEVVSREQVVHYYAELLSNMGEKEYDYTWTMLVINSTEQSFGKTRKIKSLVGELKLKAKQIHRLGLKPRSRLSPLLQKCCLRLSANESYQKAEIEIEALTGVKVGHTTQQKLVLEQDFQLPFAKQAVSEVSVDGGKVRLRGQPKAGCHWRDYKTVRLQGIYYGAFFDDNQSLVDYVNSQRLVNPLVCLGDGHDGVWNLVKEFGQSENFERWEILDWYHLKENLYKVGGSLKRNLELPARPIGLPKKQKQAPTLEECQQVTEELKVRFNTWLHANPKTDLLQIAGTKKIS